MYAPEEDVKKAFNGLMHKPLGSNGPASAGFGHTLNILFGSYGVDLESAHAKLVLQLEEGKAVTWREKTAKELGLTDT